MKTSARAFVYIALSILLACIIFYDCILTKNVLVNEMDTMDDLRQDIENLHSQLRYRKLEQFLDSSIVAHSIDAKQSSSGTSIDRTSSIYKIVYSQPHNGAVPDPSFGSAREEINRNAMRGPTWASPNRHESR